MIQPNCDRAFAFPPCDLAGHSHDWRPGNSGAIERGDRLAYVFDRFQVLTAAQGDQSEQVPRFSMLRIGLDRGPGQAFGVAQTSRLVMCYRPLDVFGTRRTGLDDSR